MNKKNSKLLTFAIVVAAFCVVLSFSTVAYVLLNDGKSNNGNIESEKPKSVENVDNESVAEVENDEKEEVKKESTAPVKDNLTVKFDGLEIKFDSNVEFTTVDNQFSEHNGAEVVKAPVTVTNTTNDLNGINMFYVKIYGSQGTQLKDVSAYFDDDFVWTISSESLRGGASMSAYCYFLYDGNGKYYISFDNYSEKVEVELSINK